MKEIFIILLSMMTILLPSAVNGQSEICWNRIDDDGDGTVDCKDQDCFDYKYCFDCDGSLHVTFDNQFIGTFDPDRGIYRDVTVLKSISQVNGIALNSSDGHLYASAILSNSKNELVIIGKDGTIKKLGLSLPSSEVYFMGSINEKNELFLGNYDSNILKIDLSQSILQVVETNIPYPGGTDFAFSKIDQKLYALSNENKLIQINVQDEVVTAFPLIGTINADNGYYGGAWSTNDGGLFFVNGTSGKIYSIDIDTKVATQTTSASGNLNFLDAGNCIDANSQIEFECNNGIDDDGDGLADCQDPDCINSNKCLIEICNNGIDDDNDGYIDCSDSECFYLDACFEICDNGIDDNNNGFIDETDEYCNTTSGNTGGLESNSRLMDAIANRHINNRKTNYKPTSFPILQNQPISARDARSKIDMSMFIPVDAIPETVTKISTPIDLIDITNATEVFTSDIFQGERRMATMMILRTENDVYEHSKTICDRLDGAQIKEISTIFYQDKQLILSEIIQANGRKEFALSFTAHFDDNGAHIENHWVKDRYSVKEEVFNFQIWSNTIGNLITLVEETFDRINTYSEITSIESSTPPRVFISHGKLNNGKLELFVINKNASKQIDLVGAKAETELSDLVNVQESFEIDGTVKSTLIYDLDDDFNIGFRIKTENGDVDDVFFADGKWGINSEENEVLIDEYSISKSEFIDEETESFKVRRNISFSAKAKGTFSIYRSLNPKFNPVNLNRFQQMSFVASGNAVLDVVLVSGDVSNWEDQAKATIILNPKEHNFNLRKEDFQSKEVIDWTKIETIHFINNNPSNIDQDVNFEIKNITFNNLQKGQYSSDKIEEGHLKIQPNPMTNTARIIVHGVDETPFTMSIVNSVGKIIRQEEGILLKGLNNFNLTKEHSMIPGVYFVQLLTTTGKSYQGKFYIE